MKRPTSKQLAAMTPEQLETYTKAFEAEQRRIAEGMMITGLALVFRHAELQQPGVDRGSLTETFSRARHFLEVAKDETGIDLLDEFMKSLRDG